jgi:uncharacterized protein (DUF1697 family)
MALVAFVRGANVGGHRRFRPSVLATELAAFDVVNVGAAGTFVVRQPGSRARFLAELRRRLPFATEIAICEGRDVLRLAEAEPFGTVAAREDVVRFVSVRTKVGRLPASIPMWIPTRREWLVRVVGADRQFVFGEYRRHMKTIGYLGKLDALFGAPVTTRNWNTVEAVIALLKERE